jgi:hypothetical protein
VSATTFGLPLRILPRFTGGHGDNRRQIVWNDFIVVGPDGDPARLRGENFRAQLIRKRRLGPTGSHRPVTFGYNLFVCW